MIYALLKQKAKRRQAAALNRKKIISNTLPISILPVVKNNIRNIPLPAKVRRIIKNIICGYVIIFIILSDKVFFFFHAIKLYAAIGACKNIINAKEAYAAE